MAFYLLQGIPSRQLDNNGNPVAGAKLYTYAAGTVTPLAAYTDSSGGTPLSNPIAADAEGFWPQIWVTAAAYKLQARKADGVSVLWESDNVQAPEAAAGGAITADLANIALGTKGAALVGFTQGLAYPASTVGNHLNQWKTLRGAGAVGDGVANDSAAVSAAFAAGGSWDGGGRTYKLSSLIAAVASGFELKNAVLDFSTAGTGSLISALGTEGSFLSLTVDAPEGTVLVSLSSTAAFSVEQYVFIKSAAVWSSNTSTYYGHYAKVKSIVSATQLELYDDLQLSFLVADAASIAPITTKTGIKLHDSVKIVGAGTGTQIGLDMKFCADSHIACEIADVDYIGVSMYRSVNIECTKAKLRRARLAGTAYGFSIAGGCYGVRVTNCYGEDQRHAVTIGDNDGLNLYTVIAANVFVNCRSAGIDSHDAAMHTTITDNQVSISSTSAAEGITMQGMNYICTGNRVTGVKDSGILFQPAYTVAAYKASAIISDNEVQLAVASAASTIPISVESGDVDIDGLVIIGNKFMGGSGITAVHHIFLVTSAANRVIENVTVIGNLSSVLATNFSFYVRAQGATSQINRLTISANQFGTAGTRCVKLLTDGAGSSINYVSGGNNIIEGGSAAAIDLDTTITNMTFGVNAFIGSTTQYLVNAASSGIYLEDLTRAAATTVTNATATVTATTNWIIVNRNTTVTLTLPAASVFAGRILTISTQQAFTVVSASSNVVPITGGAAGTAILPATAGAWARLQSNGTSWLIKEYGP